MELLKEKIKEPFHQASVQHQQEGPRSTNTRTMIKENIKRSDSKENSQNGLKYFNSKFAEFDTICGGESSEFERVPMSQYQMNYQKPEVSQGKSAENVSMENGAINIHIPCAYSYPYNPPKDDSCSNSVSTFIL